MTIAILAALALGAAAVEHHKVAAVLRSAKHKVAASAGSSPPTLAADAPVPPTVVGMNVTGLSYYGGEYALQDVIKNHAAIQIGGPRFAPGWTDLKDQVPRDAHGGLLHVPKDTKLLVLSGDVRELGNGLACHVSPGWQVSTLVVGGTQSGTKFTISRNPGNTDKELWSLVLTADRDDVSLTDLSCRSRSAPPSATFRPEFLADLKPFGIIRFMSWMRANSEPEGRWSARPTPADLTFADRGMPVENMVELANELHSDPWFTLPLAADDEYQRNFALYVREHLAPGLKAYVELSNEIWNGAFPQSKQATMIAKTKYPSEDEVHANDYYYGDRVRHMMAIWSDVFAGQKQRLVRVASVQAAWPQRGEFVLGHADTAKSVDVLAIAPYFGGIPVDVPGTGEARVKGILDRAPGEIEKQLANARQSKAIALKYGVRLVTYEAGSAYEAFIPDMQKDVGALFHDPRFAVVYQSYVTRWAKEIGGEMVLFDTTGGVWGHLEYIGQSWHEMAKMSGAVNAIASLPQGRQRGVSPVVPSP